MATDDEPHSSYRSLAQAIFKPLTSPAIVDAANIELRERVEGVALGEPSAGAYEVLTKEPQSCWDTT